MDQIFRGARLMTCLLIGTSFGGGQALARMHEEAASAPHIVKKSERASAPGVAGPIDTTPLGQVQGSVTNGVASFLGMPFAQPPVGALRWTDPQPASPWSGVRNATQYSAYCPQGFSEIGAGGGVEDCLYINVQKPANALPGANLPVMFWIYGGGLLTGSGLEYDGTSMVNTGNVIYVTFNYRLGYLGFLALSALTAENPNARSGNYGLLDQQAALSWVRQNISAFGGNPKNITIFGESAGGLSTISQLVSPRVGQIHGAIIESGAYAQTFPTLAAAQTADTSVATSLGCTSTVAATLLSCLRAIPAATLVSAQTSAVGGAGVGPNIDNYMLTEQPFAAFLDGHFARVPIVDGTNHDEARLFISEDELLGGSPFTTASFTALLDSVTSSAVSIYPVADYTSPNYAAAAAETDYTFSCPAYLLNAYASQYVPVYSYEFADPHWPNEYLPPDPNMPVIGDPHASELTYLYPQYHVPYLGYPPAYSKFSPIQKALAATMQSYWTNFAWYGRPIAPRGGSWPQYSASRVNVLSLVPPSPNLTSSFYSFHHCDFWTPFLIEQAGLPAGSAS